MISQHPVPLRAVELSCRRPAGGYGYASGYHVGGGLVLTARHVLAQGGRVEVRFGQAGHHVEGEVMWQGQAEQTDLALVRAADPGGASPPPGLGYLEATPARQVDVSVVGFPAFKSVAGADGRTRRDTEQVDGQVATTTNARSGRLEILRHGRPLTVGPAWKGISGSAVFAHDLLVGVVTAADATDSPLQAVSLAALFPESGREPAEPGPSISAFWAIVAERAPRVGPAHRRSFYRERIERLASQDLRDREDERAAIEAFVRADRHYRWIVGPPWAGKTALAAEVAARPGAYVDVVAFFVSRAQNEQTSQFRQAVCDQLAALLDIAPQQWSTQADLENLWARACARAEATGRRLLLVVDGLDENDEPPPIAALLPEQTGSHAYVLLFSRPQPPLPAEVSFDHPLRNEAGSLRTELTPSPHAGRLRERAVAELHMLLRDHDARTMLGLLAVAGPLTVPDLSALLGTDDGRFDLVHVRTLTESTPGRVLTPVPVERFAFAHDELRQSVRGQVGPEVLARHTKSVHRWADRYAELNWPDETPDYLLEHYPAFLVATGAVDRFAALPSAARISLWRRRIGHDSLAVQEITTALDLLDTGGRSDLLTIARLAMSRFRLVERVSSETYPMPAAIPAAWARAGEWNRAIFLAEHIARRDHALIAMAGTAVRDGDRDRYADLADRALAAVRRSWSPDWVIRDLARLAVVARRADDAGRCRDLLAESERRAVDLRQRRGPKPHPADGATSMKPAVMAEAAEAAAEAGRPDLGRTFLELAAASAELESSRDYYLASIARSWAKIPSDQRFPAVTEPYFAAEVAGGLALGGVDAGRIATAEAAGLLRGAADDLTRFARELTAGKTHRPKIELQLYESVLALLHIARYARELGEPELCRRTMATVETLSRQAHPGRLDGTRGRLAELFEALGDTAAADEFARIEDPEARTTTQVGRLRAAHQRGDADRVATLARQAIADARADGEHLRSQHDPRMDLVVALAECDLTGEAENLWHFLLPPRGYDSGSPDLVPVLIEVGDLDRAAQFLPDGDAEAAVTLAAALAERGRFDEAAQQVVRIGHQVEVVPYGFDRAAVGAARGGFFDRSRWFLEMAERTREIRVPSPLAVPAAAAPAEIAALAAGAGRPTLAREFAQVAARLAGDDLARAAEAPQRSPFSMTDFLRNFGVTVPAAGMHSAPDADKLHGLLAWAEAASGSPFRPTLARISSPAERAEALVRISRLPTGSVDDLAEACRAVAGWDDATDFAKDVALTNIAVAAAAARATDLVESTLDRLTPDGRSRVHAALATGAAAAGDHVEARRRLDLAGAQDGPVDALVRAALHFDPQRAADLLRHALVTGRDTPALLPLLVLVDPASASTVLDLTGRSRP